jgi:hypothetical protein
MRRSLNRTPSLGTVSHGTHRAEDLLPAFWDALRYYMGPRRALKRMSEYRDILRSMERDGFDWDGEDVDYALEAIQDALSEIAPPYVYFGSTEGDGSDFGFWVAHDAIQESIRCGELAQITDASEMDKGTDGYIEPGSDGWVLVNDHGNVTIYSLRKKAVLECV